MKYSYTESKEFLDKALQNIGEEIYLDNSATTHIRSEVLEAMLPYFKEEYANPSAFYSKAKRVREALDNAREVVAGHLNCKAKDIIFTAGGTESDNLAILGYCRSNKQKGKHILTSTVEHHAVLNTFEHLEKHEGFEVTYLEVNKYGQVELDTLEKAIREDTIFCSIIYANNEIGTINNISELGRICKKNNVVFHSDACQAGSYLNLDVEKLNVDLFTLNGSKIYGPKGVGCLYINPKIKIEPLIYGGVQERGLRPGTENVPGFIGLATALDLVQKEKEEELPRIIKLRDRLISGILDNIEKTSLNGHPEERLPFNVNITFLDIEGEAVILYLNEHNICISSGSACTSRSLDPSHVITALGFPYEYAHGSLRFTLGKSTTSEEIDRVLEILPHVVNILRNISPVKT